MLLFRPSFHQGLSKGKTNKTWVDHKHINLYPKFGEQPAQYIMHLLLQQISFHNKFLSSSTELVFQWVRERSGPKQGSVYDSNDKVNVMFNYCHKFLALLKKRKLYWWIYFFCFGFRVSIKRSPRQICVLFIIIKQ